MSVDPALPHADHPELLTHEKLEEGCVSSCLPTENVLFTPQNTLGHSRVPCVQQVCVWVCPEASTGDNTVGSSSQKGEEVALKLARAFFSFKERLKFSRHRNCSQSGQMKVRKAGGG